MPRPARPWYRYYTEMPSDRKIRRLTPAQRWLWTAMMSAARESPVVGKLFVAEDMPMTYSELASYADVKEREIAPAVELMIRLKMVHIEADEVLVITNFEKRQYESDTSTARTRKHRSKQGDGNNVGTFQPRSQEHPSNDHGNAPETEADNRDRSTSVSTSSETGVALLNRSQPSMPPSNGRPAPKTMNDRTADALLVAERLRAQGQ